MRLKVLFFPPGSDIWENINQTYRFSRRKNLENSSVERDWVDNIGRKLDVTLQCSITAKEPFLNFIFFSFFQSADEEPSHHYSGRSNNPILFENGETENLGWSHKMLNISYRMPLGPSDAEESWTLEDSGRDWTTFHHKVAEQLEGNSKKCNASDCWGDWLTRKD